MGRWDTGDTDTDDLFLRSDREKSCGLKVRERRYIARLSDSGDEAEITQCCGPETCSCSRLLGAIPVGRVCRRLWNGPTRLQS